MYEIMLEMKLSNIQREVRESIEDYVKHRAKFKIGDVVESGISEKSYFVITQVGFLSNLDFKGVIYFGRRLRKSDGEVTFYDMDSGIGTYERYIKKSTLVLKDGTQISKINDSVYFNKNIKINFVV